MLHNTKKLVIDTNVAISAGNEHPVDLRPKICKDFLMAVFEYKHDMVVTEAIYTELRNHPASFLTQWLAMMYKKGKVYKIDAPMNNAFRHKLEEATNDNGIRIAMLKDAHLIEAAVQADRIVISMDERVRRYFNEATMLLIELRKITWANPCKEDEKVIEWLKRGAKWEEERRLGYNKDT